ncbi:MAG: hypothetical protein E5Y00_12250, partial [Mesorhizobium sp.]
MLRTIFSLSALAAGLAASGALAAPSLEGAQKTVRSAQHGALLLAQDGNIDIYYDARGNRVLVDADTGKVIAIQPPQTRLDRRALRRQLRMQELGHAPVEDDDRYYLDDPDDMARFRRRQLDENGRYIPPPVDDYDSNSGNSVEAYPPAPSDEGYATTYPEAPR